MSTSLTQILADPPSGRRRAVLFDHHEYARRIILQGKEVPWADPMAYSNFYGQAQSLLTGDAAILDLGRFYAHRLALDSSVIEAMGAKSRTGFALRTLLGDEQLTRAARDVASTFTKTQRVPVVLRLPSPQQWLASAHALVDAPGLAELDADDAEKGAMYVADWLRNFADLDLAGVLLDERQATTADLPQVPASTYSPVANVTENYRWPLAIQWGDRVELVGHEGVGVVLDEDFWTGEVVTPPAGDFLVTEIPATAEPEEVVARVALLS